MTGEIGEGNQQGKPRRNRSSRSPDQCERGGGGDRPLALGDGRAHRLPIPSAAWRPPAPARPWPAYRKRPIALRPRLAAGLPFRGWKAFWPGLDTQACPRKPPPKLAAPFAS